MDRRLQTIPRWTDANGEKIKSRNNLMVLFSEIRGREAAPNALRVRRVLLLVQKSGALARHSRWIHRGVPH